MLPLPCSSPTQFVIMYDTEPSPNGVQARAIVNPISGFTCWFGFSRGLEVLKFLAELWLDPSLEVDMEPGK